MADNRDNLRPVQQLALRVLDMLGSIRPHERRDAAGAFLTLFGFMAGHALLETARDALFLAGLPAALLPWVYLTIAALALVLIRFHGHLGRYFQKRQELSGWLLVSGIVTLLFWAAVPWVGDWIYYMLYVWSGLLSTLVVVQFWTLLSSRFTVTQAKRLFAVVGSGSVLGAIVGSGLARVLTEMLPAQHLVLVAAIVFLSSSLAPVLLEAAPRSAQPARQPAQSIDMRRVGALVWGRPYLRRVAITVLLSTVTFTLVDFVFKSTVARLVPDEGLGEFFASVYFSLNIVSLLVQVIVVSRVLRHVGVSAAIAIVPALLFVSALGFVAAAGLLTVLLLKGTDGSLRYSLYRTTTELLFVPMSAEIRGRVKAFIDVLGQRGGQALGSLLVLLILTVTTSEAVIAFFAAAAAGAWLAMAVGLRRHYLDVFRETLSEDINATQIEFPALDLASLETLLATLNSADDRRVVAALGLLAEQGKTRVIPGLILYHPSPAVVIYALELFSSARRDDALPLIDRLLADRNADVRAAALRVRTALLPDQESLRRGLRDASAKVEVTALVGLVAGGWMQINDARAQFQSAIESNDTDTILALARAIRALPMPKFNDVLLAVSKVQQPNVQLEAIHAMRALRDPSFTPALITMLAHRALRDDARAALVELGPVALSMLGTALFNSEMEHSIRRHLPKSIAAFGAPQAAGILLRQLLDEPDGMVRFKILRALGNMRANNPMLPLDRNMLRQAIDQNVAAAFRYMRWRRALASGAQRMPDRRTDCHAALAGLLRDKQAHAIERLFRLQNLFANDEEFLRIYRGLHSSSRESRAGGRELIEHLVEPPLRQQMLALVDDLDESSEPTGAEPMRKQPGYDELLAELLSSGVESLSSLAAYHAGELHLTAMRQSLADVSALTPAHAAVVADVLIGLQRSDRMAEPVDE